MEGILLVDLGRIKEAFEELVGITGDKFVGEICDKGYLSQESYVEIVKLSAHKPKEIIVQHYGIVHYCYLQSIN